MRRLISLCLLISMTLALVIPASARTFENTWEYFDRVPSSGDCSFADIAVMELAMYGFLDEEFITNHELSQKHIDRLTAIQLLYQIFGDNKKASHHPFIDVPSSYNNAVMWAYENKVTNGVNATHFGIGPLTEQAYVTFLLRSMGYADDFSYENALEFANTIGFGDMLYVGEDFNIGKVALYTTTAFDMPFKDSETTILEDLGLEYQHDPVGYPQTVKIYPRTPEECEEQIKYATYHYLPVKVDIYDDYLSEETFEKMYSDWYELRESWSWPVNQYPDEEPWWIDVSNMFGVYGNFKAPFENGSPTGLEYREKYNALSQQYKDKEISSEEFRVESMKLDCEYKQLKSPMQFTLSPDESYILAYGDKEFFQTYKNTEVRDWLEKLYDENIKKLEDRTEKEKIKGVKALICDTVTYDWQGWRAGKSEPHYLTGAYLNRALVCDGYSHMFMYFMYRLGIPCIEVTGSLQSSKNAKNFNTDHSWNKVKVDGAWYNMDICWADTDNYTRWDLRCDADFANRQHWISGYDNGFIASPKNYY